MFFTQYLNLSRFSSLFFHNFFASKNWPPELCYFCPGAHLFKNTTVHLNPQTYVYLGKNSFQKVEEINATAEAELFYCECFSTLKNHTLKEFLVSTQMNG